MMMREKNSFEKDGYFSLSLFFFLFPPMYLFWCIDAMSGVLRSLLLLFFGRHLSLKFVFVLVFFFSLFLLLVVVLFSFSSFFCFDLSLLTISFSLFFFFFFWFFAFPVGGLLFLLLFLCVFNSLIYPLFVCVGSSIRRGR